MSHDYTGMLKQLRRTDRHGYPSCCMCYEAADTISALVAERDALQGEYNALEHNCDDAHSRCMGYKTERDAAVEALRNLVKVNEDWNAAVSKIVPTPPTWADSYLDAARAVLAARQPTDPK
jgi:hypothetical protein